MELSLNELGRLQNKLQQTLHLIPNLQLWNVYLNFVLRTQDLESDTPTVAPARKIIMEVYQAVLDQVGIDRDAGSIWQSYIQFIQSSPHTAGGPTLDDQKKLDTLRKAYQQAISVPTQAVQTIWQEYYAFENNLNKATVRQLLFLHSEG
jgi:cleavage stimulation factor subunit 3